MRAAPPVLWRLLHNTGQIGPLAASVRKFTVRAERGSDRDCLVLWPAQKVGAVRDDAGVRERPDVGEVGGVDLGTAGAHAPRDNLGPGGLSVN